MCEIKFHEEL